MPDRVERILRHTLQEVYERAPEVQCQCGEALGEACAWSGPRSETVVVEWMPEYLRSSHTAAGNRGVYPANGARRLRVERECAERLLRDEWVSKVEEST